MYLQAKWYLKTSILERRNDITSYVAYIINVKGYRREGSSVGRFFENLGKNR